MGVYLRDDTWYIDYYYKGKRFREKVGKRKREAEKAFAIRKAEIAEDRFGLNRLEKQVKFEKLCEEYLPYSKSYKRSYKRDVQHIKHLRNFFDGLSLDEIKPRLIDGVFFSITCSGRLGTCMKPAGISSSSSER